MYGFRETMVDKIDKLIENLKSGEQKVVIDTIKELGEIGDTKAVNPLIRTLNVDNRWVCSRSADALGKIGDIRAVKPLISMLKSTRKMTYNSPMDNPYYAAAKALDVLKWEPEKDEDLVFYLLITQGSELPVDAVWQVGYGYIRIDNKNPLVKLGASAVEHLIKALESGDRNACEIAVRTLGVIRDIRAVEPLIKALEVIDRIKFFRQYGYWELGDWKGMFNAVVETLVKFGDNRAVSPFVEALVRDDEAWDLNIRSDYHGLITVPIIEALMKIGIDTITESERSAVGLELRIMLDIVADEEGNWNPDVFDVGTIGAWICEIGPSYSTIDGQNQSFCDLFVQTLETSGETQLLIRVMEESRGICNRAAAKALDRLGWQPDTDELRANYLIATEQGDQCRNSEVSTVEPLTREPEYKEEEGYDDYGIYVSKQLVSSGLKLSPEKQKEIEEVSAKLLPKEKVMNLEQEEFAEIVKERSKFLGMMENPCTSVEIMELLSDSSPQVRWLVACAVVEISCYDNATVDKIMGQNIHLFKHCLSDYTKPIKKADRDEIVRSLKLLPSLVLKLKVGIGLYNSALSAMSNPDPLVKKNCSMLTTVFEDPELAKMILGSM